MTAKKDAHTHMSQDDDLWIQSQLARRQEIAEALHDSTSRTQAESLLSPVFSADEAAQMALLKRLIRERDVDSADLLLAIHELAPEKTVRKEARRALIQLAGVKVYPSWTPEPEATSAGSLGVENAPRFWKGTVAEMRESGEVQLVLCWEQGFAYGEARILTFLLNFWQEGVKDFFTEVGSKRHIESHLSEIQSVTQSGDPTLLEEGESEQPATYVDCTLAEGRRLLNEALAVNRWRETELHKDFRQHLSLVQQLVLHAHDAGEDRGTTFVSRGLEPDMVAANFAGAWSMGDYGLCYDLLARKSTLREAQERSEWIDLRRNWADEAHPSHFEIYFVREQEQNKPSALWLPNSVLSVRAATQKEIELGWSLAVTETQLSGTLPEMPMGTAVYKETGRRWFWNNFTLLQEDGEWRISRIRDEGVALQGLPLDELEKRINEHSDLIQNIAKEHNPSDTDAQQYLDEIVQHTWKILSLEDACLVKNPLDKKLYEEAYSRAMSVRAVERAAVYAESLAIRFPGDSDHLLALQRLGMVQVAMAERFSSLGLEEQAAQFITEGEATLRGTLDAEEPVGHLLLAELLISSEKYDEAEQLLLKARSFGQQERELQAQIEFDLASLAMERERFAEAQSYLERLAEIAPDYPALWATLGYIHHQQKNIPEAEVYYKRAIEEEPGDVRVYSELGSIYVEQSAFDKARDILLQGIRALPHSAQLRALLATVYLEQGDRRRAMECLEEAERINPGLEIVQALREVLTRK
jgi:tetratricopeptide (TPR) repeat protein